MEDWKNGGEWCFSVLDAHYSIIPLTQERGEGKTMPLRSGWELGISCYGVFDGGH
jgi:hypothetical protein